MKKLVLLLVMVLSATFTFAENDNYTQAMSAALTALGEASSPDDFKAVANQFERIANVETDQWLPNYYAAYAMLINASNQKDGAKKDGGLDAAQQFLDKAAENEHDKSEVAALQGFIHMIRIGVDPASRGPQYSGMSAAALQKSIAINPNNPRAMHLLAQLSFGTAQFFGSDTSEACGQNEAAIKLFTAEEAAQKSDPLAPAWGKHMAEGFQRQCGG